MWEQSGDVEEGVGGAGGSRSGGGGKGGARFAGGGEADGDGERERVSERGGEGGRERAAEEVSWSEGRRVVTGREGEVYLGVIVCVRDRTESIKKLVAGLGTSVCLLYWYKSGGLLVQRYKY